MHDDHDTDDLDFAMLTPPTRPGPAKAATAPEVDPVERRLEREQEAAPNIARALMLADDMLTRAFAMRGVEVHHGSGKVKV